MKHHYGYETSHRDTAGQERFDTITKQYYRRAQGVILVYDISNAGSFRHIDKWLGFLKSAACRAIAADCVTASLHAGSTPAPSAT